MLLKEYLRLLRAGAKVFERDILDETNVDDEIDPLELNERFAEFMQERLDDDGDDGDDDELNELNFDDV